MLGTRPREARLDRCAGREIHPLTGIVCLAARRCCRTAALAATAIAGPRTGILLGQHRSKRCAPRWLTLTRCGAQWCCSPRCARRSPALRVHPPFLCHARGGGKRRLEEVEVENHGCEGLRCRRNRRHSGRPSRAHAARGRGAGVDLRAGRYRRGAHRLRRGEQLSRQRQLHRGRRAATAQGVRDRRGSRRHHPPVAHALPQGHLPRFARACRRPRQRHRHRAVGPQGQGARPADLRSARRQVAPRRASLRQWLVRGLRDARAVRRRPRRGVADGHVAIKLDPYLEMQRFHTGYLGGQISAAGEDEAPPSSRRSARQSGRGRDPDRRHGNFNVPTAVRLARGLEPYRIGWFEEPVPPESIQALRSVRDQVGVPICVGERLYTRWDFLPVFEQRLTDFVMPDVVWTGGISELMRIASLAEAYHVPLSARITRWGRCRSRRSHVGWTVPTFTAWSTASPSSPPTKPASRAAHLRRGARPTVRPSGPRPRPRFAFLRANPAPAGRTTQPSERLHARRSRRRASLDSRSYGAGNRRT